MKKFKKVFSLLLVGAMTLSMAACGSSSKKASTSKKGGSVKVGIITDTGGVNDGSFNQSAWEGLQRAEKDLGIEVKYLESKNEADYKPNIETFVDNDYDMIICIGFALADALKEEGWEFDSHTWGHLSVTDKSVEALKTDNERWVATVEPIVGKVDTIIFAHGNDIGSWEGYEGNEQYDYYNSAVDGSVPYWVQITDRYVRQGRIDVDGYRLWLALNGEDSSLSKVVDVTGIFNQERPTPVVANGEV